MCCLRNTINLLEAINEYGQLIIIIITGPAAFGGFLFATLCIPDGKTCADGGHFLFNRNGVKMRGKRFIKNLLDTPTLTSISLAVFY